jgi:phosphorylase kinase alpha/beta subunit
MKKMSLLNTLYNDINDIIIKRQHPVTGLLPASTAITTHGDYTDAWVRDNVYSILSVWSLGMAYRRNGEKVRCDELEQSTIKLMRGLLQSMMRQSPKVEKFKHTLDPMDCLHAKYDTNTGLNIVDDHEWGHLQIDATSIFLLMVGQMSASGLRIINTIDEVDFIQNLVYYIAFAYRTPDYGIWERGNKINNGKTEINASSVGMAKAALQALDGFNLFGRDGNPRAIIHTIPDAISRARNTLARLLPRESISKEVDSAILSIIGFPAFAVGDKQLVNKTRDKILSELGGKYGCKRFLWDGHQTAIEDHSRMHYEHSELANFENIESEWPLFYTYLYIQALFEGDAKEAKKYRKLLESVMVEVDGKKLLPELYYVAKEDIEAERKNPGSQIRHPNENIPLVWAQSLYFTGLMLDEGLLEHDDLDPLKLRSRSTKTIESQLALVVLAENDSVKQQLAEKGVIAETINEISPIKVLSAAELVQSYRKVGANCNLALSGRPKRRFQGLATAQAYTINNQPYLSLSSLQFDENNYRLFDAELAASNLKREVSYISKNWINNEVAVFTYLLTQDMCDAVNADVLLNTIRNLQLRTERSNVGYASANLALRASRVNNLVVPDSEIQALNDTPMTSSSRMYPFDITYLSSDLQFELKAFEESDQLSYQQLNKWLEHYQLDSELSQQADYSLTFEELLKAIYNKAQHQHYWLTARCCFSLLNYVHQDLADDVSLVCARHISIIIGNENQAVLNSEHALLKPKKLVNILDNAVTSPIERTIVQELLVILGNTIRTDAKTFRGLRSIKLNSLSALCVNNAEFNEETLIELAVKSPHEISQLVLNILASQQQAFREDNDFSFSQQLKNLSSSNLANAMDTDWLQWRSERGLFTRFDDQFLTDIWKSLANTNAIVFADHEHAQEVLPSAETRSSMTPREESFAHKIDELILQLHPTYYKSAVVEALFAYTQHCIKAPDTHIDKVVLGKVLQDAADLFILENSELNSNERNLDILMNQPPATLQTYALKVFAQQ